MPIQTIRLTITKFLTRSTSIIFSLTVDRIIFTGLTKCHFKLVTIITEEQCCAVLILIFQSRDKFGFELYIVHHRVLVIVWIGSYFNVTVALASEITAV